MPERPLDDLRVVDLSDGVVRSCFTSSSMPGQRDRDVLERESELN